MAQRHHSLLPLQCHRCGGIVMGNLRVSQFVGKIQHWIRQASCSTTVEAGRRFPCEVEVA